MLSTHLIFCDPLLLLPSIFPSIRVFSNVSALHIRWPKYWSFSISPPNEYSALISFRIDSFDLLTICGHLNLDCTHRTWPLDVAQFTPLNGFSTAGLGSMGKWRQQKRLLPPRKVWETQTQGRSVSHAGPTWHILEFSSLFLKCQKNSLYLKNIYWGVMAWQCCISFYCTAHWVSYMFTYIPSLGISFPFSSPQSIE